MSAFHLASPNGDGTFSPSHHSFASPEVAARAAARLNVVHGARDLPPYTAVAEHDGVAFVRVTELPRIAA